VCFRSCLRHTVRNRKWTPAFRCLVFKMKLQ
jgi:hypothetical protein